HVALGHVSNSEAGLRPLTITRLRSALESISQAPQDELSATDKKLIKRFRSEFNLADYPLGIQGPWQKKYLKKAFKEELVSYDLARPDPRILTYRDSLLSFWGDFRVTAVVERIDSKKNYLRNADHLRLYGSFNKNLAFYTELTMHHINADTSLIPQFEVYRNEELNFFPEYNSSVWYQTQSSVYYDGKWLDVQAGNKPFGWGYSPSYSPILALEVPPFPFISLSAKYGSLRFQTLHASLLAHTSEVLHAREAKLEKYLAAHRIEVDINKNLTVGFSEMVLYGGRSPELDYMIPVSFFLPVEHNLGDLDNLLMAFDSYWRIRPGLALYQTLFWDELYWTKALENWWGNKFIYQAGIHWVPSGGGGSRYLPDIRLELAVARPWTYSHEDSVNTYTSADIGLGLPQGPNAQSLLIESTWWPTYRWWLKGSVLWMKKGTVLGSSPLDDHDSRDHNLDYATPLLLGETINSTEIRLETRYTVSQMVELVVRLRKISTDSDLTGYLGLIFEW
ncbi:MAG: hypothetical protein V3U16_01775, partial [Candidatus Neomarinimicrobiota bacterium]